MDILLSLLLGMSIGSLLIYYVVFRNFLNNQTQNTNNELQSILDETTPREFYIHKMSQTNLVWDKKTQTYIKKWRNDDDS